MSRNESVKVRRDCKAIQIPDGIPVTVPEGTQVWITQALGGSYTVMTEYGQLLRIDEEEADAIGKEVPRSADEEQAAEGKSVEEKVWTQMKKCYDPEIPVNIVDLGLVYDCQIEDHPEGGHRVSVKMTLTAPGCGMGGVLAQDVKQRVESLSEVKEAQVEIVFDPQWNPSMMSEAAKLELGFL